MKIGMKLYVGAGLILELTGASYAQASDRYHCAVSQITPPTANFFSIVGRRPKIGDLIDIDLSATEITDLTFASGGQIPLKQVNAILVNKTPIQNPIYSRFFEGLYTSPTSVYTGILYSYEGEGKATVIVEILRKRNFEGMTLHQLRMNCAALP